MSCLVLVHRDSFLCLLSTILPVPEKPLFSGNPQHMSISSWLPLLSSDSTDTGRQWSWGNPKPVTYVWWLCLMSFIITLRGSSLDLRLCTGIQLRWRTFGFLHQPKGKHVQRCPKLRWQYLRHSSSSLHLGGPASWRWLGLHPASQTTRFSREAALAICITRVRSCILPRKQKSSALSRPRRLCSHLPKIPLCW